MHKVCSNCVMDTSDPHIRFDERGRCGYCRNFHENIVPDWHPDERGAEELERLADRIRRDGRGRTHDCLIGLSGGPDSSYATYVARTMMGLNPLLYHVDAGWDMPRAADNIRKLVAGLGLELETEVVDWDEMRDLQVAFLKSQVPDQDYPQDTAFFSALYRFARRNGFKYVITGANYSTECVREPEEWGAPIGIDARLLRDIHRRFGTRPLETFPVVDILDYKVRYQLLGGMKIVKPLDLVPYRKKESERELGERYGWEGFAHKHFESRFTIFYESYWLPRKFGFDKRRAQFSSLILTGQMTRDEALERLSRPELDEVALEGVFAQVAERLGLSAEELGEIFRGENRTTADYRNKRRLIAVGARAMRFLGLEKRKFL